MKRAEQANARRHTYLVCSHLYLNGLTADLLPYISHIPQLQETCSTKFDQDEASAAHTQVFANNIAPYEGIYLDTSGLLGGIHSERVKSRYQDAGIHFTQGDDHIGHETAFMASLCQAEADYLELGEMPAADHFRLLQRQFQEEHLLRWLPAFVISLRFSGQPFFYALGKLTLALVYDHWAAIRIARPDLSLHQIDNHRNKLDELLYEKNTDLSQIAKYLLTPSLSGIYLGQKTISELALQNQIPRGFGSRKQMLSNLFRSASQYDLVPKLLQDLQDHSAGWAYLYQQQIEHYPLLKTYNAIWLKLVDTTANALSNMKTQFLEMAISQNSRENQTNFNP